MEIDDIKKITEHYQEVYRLHKLNQCNFYSECIFCEVDNQPSNTQMDVDSLKPAMLEGVEYTIEYIDYETVVFTRCR